MRKRNVHIQFWLDKKEAEAFQKKVKKSGLSREAYLRHLVTGLEPQDAPPPDYYAMMLSLIHIYQRCQDRASGGFFAEQRILQV